MLAYPAAGYAGLVIQLVRQSLILQNQQTSIQMALKVSLRTAGVKSYSINNFSRGHLPEEEGFFLSVSSTFSSVPHEC